MTSDRDLISALDSQREIAKQAFQYEYASKAATPEGVPAVWEISPSIQAVMDQHPDFAQQRSNFFLGKQLGFFNHHQAVNLLRVSLSIGSANAVEWYRKVLATKQAQMRVIAEVYGLQVKKPVQLSNGVRLLPIADLPDSPNSQSLKQPQYVRLGFAFSAAAMIEVGTVEADDDHKRGHAHFLEILAMMRKTITAFVLSKDAAPTMAAGWQEFVDPEMEAAAFGRMWMSSQHEGRHVEHPADISPETLEWVEKYLDLPPEVAGACQVSLDRLNLARRRIRPGDKAIDGSVCLEALLSGKARGELTHRLSVRTALLLGKDLSERTEIAEKIRKFYQLRSDVVHGSAARRQATSQDIAEEGLRLCLLALQAVINSRVVPQPEVWELAGGPPGNRRVD